MQITIRGIPECAFSALSKEATKQGYELESYVLHVLYKELERAESKSTITAS